MAKVTVADLQEQIAELSRRLSAFESRNGHAAPPTVLAPQVVAAPVPESIGEEELLAISAAIGAYLGVRAHIRGIRLLSSNAWAQQGRVSIQASHSLEG